MAKSHSKHGAHVQREKAAAPKPEAVAPAPPGENGPAPEETPPGGPQQPPAEPPWGAWVALLVWVAGFVFLFLDLLYEQVVGLFRR